MAVKKITAPEKFVGTYSDTRPTHVRTGATYYCSDTGSMEITTDDGTTWVEKDTIVRLETSPTIDIGDVTLLAGTALVGKVGIDQTTKGTTDGVTEASASAIKTAVELIDNMISGSEAQVDIVAALPAGTNLIGKAGIDQVTANANEVVIKSGTVTAVTDITNALPAGTNALGKVGHDTTGLGHGVKTVSTVGTDEVLAASTACKWVIIQAQTDNTGAVAVGATGVDATIATGNGIILYAGDSITLQTDNLNDVYVDALIAGEGVRYTYGT